ncbi:MAG: MFS transporter [Sedimentibacter sp.]|uniref:MFS transporter n=1 Tax=Sedimentibacter sp. TaxID=1960295 RepID=UPI00315867BC
MNNNKLTNKTIYSYGLGEFGFNFFNLLVAYYLLIFLTNIQKFPVTQAAAIYSTVQWFEAIAALCCGILVDRVNFKTGKYWPWLIIGSSICSVSTVLFFSKFDVGKDLSVVLFLVFYLLAYFGYDFMWVAYRSLLGVIGKDSVETVSLSVGASQLGTIAGIIFSYLGVKLLGDFSDSATGYTASAAVYGFIMLISMLIVARVAKPYDKVENFSVNKNNSKLSFKEILKTINGPIIPFIVSQIFRYASSTLLFTLIVYHFKYFIGNETIMSSYILIYTVFQFIGFFAVKFFVKRFDKLAIYNVSTLIASALTVLIFLFSERILVFMLLLSVYSFVYSFGAALYMPFITDIADYNEIDRNISGRAFSYSIGSSCMHFASVLGASIASFGLSAIGYNQSLPVQPQDVAYGISALTFLGSAALTAISVIPMYFYKLNGKIMKDIYKKKEGLYYTKQLG